MANIFKGDYGTVFEILVQEDGNVVDVSAVTNIEVSLTKPDATVLSKTGIKKTDGTDGFIEFTISDGDLDQAGVWRLQLRLTFPFGRFRTSSVAFDVAA